MLNEGPDKLLDVSDPGDDVSARFKYQHTYAALTAIKAIDETSDVETVICENHEDFIVKLTNGKFIAVQVKTRSISLEKLKANDSSVKKALTKFCRLEQKFPDEFQNYDLSTNFNFWTEKEDHRNLPYLLAKTMERGNLKRLRKGTTLKTFIESISEGETFSAEVVFSALSKTVLNGRDEKVGHLSSVLIDAVGQTDIGRDLTYADTVRLSERLIHIACDASSLRLGKNVQAAYEPGVSFQNAINNLQLEGKTLTSDTISGYFDEFSNNSSEPLSIEGLVPLEDLPHDLARMFQKLAAGELQKCRIDLMEDLVRSFQHLQVKWSRKYGPDKAKELTDDLLAKVLVDCVEAEAKIGDTGVPFAKEKYDNLRDELKERVSSQITSPHSVTREHMLGAAGVLTEQCKVWWSPVFDLMEDQSG